jgi:hypothetical protein
MRYFNWPYYQFYIMTQAKKSTNMQSSSENQKILHLPIESSLELLNPQAVSS